MPWMTSRGQPLPRRRRSPSSSGRRGRAYTPPRSRSRDDLYDPDPRDFPHSREPRYDDFRSRDRPHADPRAHYRSRDPRDAGSRSGDPQYDGRLIEEALRKKSGERGRPYKEEEETYYPPAPPPYSENDSQSSSSRERRLKKNLALSRESLVV
ncbi:Lipolysis-stimulated lipoprotein receptor [Tupaia chinensis]|uniref:Lipolysis-stimulated lipoprotein receptor n=1 Tax=Tupaia chinensis TaxID=246437 RepID=L8Y4P0_TUPCH|nr:Lipolysis-stimulated lipoprotein receptor [Tupaia chinensis]